MEETKLRLSDDTVAYWDNERHKLIIEIDLPEKSTIQPKDYADILCQLKQKN
ncbi:MAG: hypothetical protein V1701_11730 [Planctomycetota bacterium]